MINLKVVPYCQKCGSFKAVTQCHTIYSGPGLYENLTDIVCTNAEKCRALYRHIEESHVEKAIKTIYAVAIHRECDDSWYPDYTDIYCLCSTKEKAEEQVKSLEEEHKDSDPQGFAGAEIVEYVLDVIPY